jgi:hypothetical protein
LKGVSSVDSREKITKYVLSTLGAWQMQKKILNTIY